MIGPVSRILVEMSDGNDGEIPECNGVYANAGTLEDCREQLQEVLEEWVLFRVHKHLPLPAIDGIELTIQEVA